MFGDYSYEMKINLAKGGPIYEIVFRDTHYRQRNITSHRLRDGDLILEVSFTGEGPHR